MKACFQYDKTKKRAEFRSEADDEVGVPDPLLTDGAQTLSERGGALDSLFPLQKKPPFIPRLKSWNERRRCVPRHPLLKMVRAITLLNISKIRAVLI
jgi:hypothetical protein